MFSTAFPQPMAYVHEGFLTLSQALKMALLRSVLQETYFLTKKWKNIEETQLSTAVPAPLLPIPCDHTEAWKTVHKKTISYQHLQG